MPWEIGLPLLILANLVLVSSSRVLRSRLFPPSSLAISFHAVLNVSMHDKMWAWSPKTCPILLPIMLRNWPNMLTTFASLTAHVVPCDVKLK